MSTLTFEKMLFKLVINSEYENGKLVDFDRYLKSANKWFNKEGFKGNYFTKESLLELNYFRVEYKRIS